ncbi:MAG: hypothetical protein E7474_10010 [Ruminococcaceae bacterium]|nr:hypothetical protein [Oscillospiraceae bacterium]
MKAKRGEEALMRLLAKSVSAQRDAVYLERDGETVWFPHRGSVAGFHLIHRSGADCRYAFLPERVGPFPTDIEGLGELGEIRVEQYYPCPFCFAGTPIMDDLERGDAERVQTIRRVLSEGRWRRGYYTGDEPKASAPAKKAAPAKPTAPPKRVAPGNKAIPVYKKAETSGFYYNRPEKGSLEFKRYEVTVNRDSVWLELDFVSPLPIRKDSRLDVTTSLKISYVKNGIFGPRTVTVLPGERTTKDSRVFPWDKHEGEGYGYGVSLHYYRWEMSKPGGTGRYTIDFTLDDENFDRQSVEKVRSRLEGDLTVRKRR